MADASVQSGDPFRWSDFDARLVVEVRNRFDGSWSHGFEVVEHVTGDAGTAGASYRLRRLSDGRILPELFSADDIISATYNFE